MDHDCDWSEYLSGWVRHLGFRHQVLLNVEDVEEGGGAAVGGLARGAWMVASYDRYGRVLLHNVGYMAETLFEWGAK